MVPKPKRLTVEEAAAWLDMKPRLLRKRIQEGLVKVIKDSSPMLIAEAEVERYDREREQFRK